ncbi:MAG: dTDP-4-dehydrorhamnose reductase [Pseudomonadota bacterium]
MKILITGANGQVGFCLAKAFAKKKYDYQALTREQLDISNLSAVKKIVATYAPDIIINAAAYTAVDKAESEIELAYKINFEGARNLAEAAVANDAAIFHISTDYVFSGNAEAAYKETDLTSPQSVYGESKLAGELAVVQANAKHIILRTAWVFGEHGNNFVKTMIRLGRDRDQLGIVADQRGGPTYAGDIADALLKIVAIFEKNKELPWGIYHYSGHPHTNWFEFASQIFNEVSNENIYTKKIPSLKAIATTDYPTPAKRPANSCLNCDSIQNNFGIQPSNWKLALKNIKAYV